VRHLHPEYKSDTHVFDSCGLLDSGRQVGRSWDPRQIGAMTAPSLHDKSCRLLAPGSHLVFSCMPFSCSFKQAAGWTAWWQEFGLNQTLHIPAETCYWHTCVLPVCPAYPSDPDGTWDPAE
jgi:hypothetical protein